MRLWICAAAVNGFLAVALGAHAAHGLRGRADPEIVTWVNIKDLWYNVSGGLGGVVRFRVRPARRAGGRALGLMAVAARAHFTAAQGREMEIS